jgi:nitrate reductase molybdenum cofactor assembly chaperone NarJ/NarW
MGSFALISEALRYPDAEVLDLRADVLEEARLLPPTPAVDALVSFAVWWAAEPPSELERTYVGTFDFARRTALDLTYYTHGDRRQRGLALVALRRRYAAAGLELETAELPDHLPVVLEFAALAPEPGGELLAEFRPVVELLRMALEKAASPYAAALCALCLMLPTLTAAEEKELRRIAREGPPDESVGLEPFAPPEVMPEPIRRGPAACGAVPGGGR